MGKAINIESISGEFSLQKISNFARLSRFVCIIDEKLMEKHKLAVWGWENAFAIWLQGKLSLAKFSMELRKWARVFTRFTFDCTISPQITCSWPPTSLVNNTFHSNFAPLPCSIQVENFSVQNFRLPRNERARIRLNIINEKFRVEINFV